MSLKDEFRKMIRELGARFAIPPIADVFFPPFYKGGQPKDAEFMAMCLEGEAAGISYVLLPDEKEDEYTALRSVDFVGKDPHGFALEFGNDDPIQEIISLAAINSICQHVMKVSSFPIDSATDSLGLLSVSSGDRIGMVGLFFPLIKRIREAGAELVVLEKKEHLIHEYPDLPITLDAAELRRCNKVLSTSTTILNNSLDEILSSCSPNALISVIGPTAGYFPDPLFTRGVDILGGRVVKDGARFLQLLAARTRWGDATEKVCFQKETYTSIIGS